jgi:hypothetical protein
MPAPRKIAELIERFNQQGDAYKSGQYNEAQLRQEFIDPMFEALGWDMENKNDYAEAYKDVIHEDAIKIGGATKAPDYCFRIGGTRKFFLEAKKPSVDIKTDAQPAYQLRRYAWSAKLPLSVLTDFEEFAVYDCRVEPKLADKASVARVFYLTFHEYASKWDEIAKIFARDAILKGSFDKFAESNKAKRGTAQVDDAFLYEIEQWRADLARNLATRNPKLSQRDLNFSVQRTIDRIVFLRICEDRRIEVYGRLQALLNGEHTYDRMRQLFREADDRYNSGLFHFQKEKDRVEPPDDLTPGLEIDDAVLKKIIRRLYYPESPYEFSVLPADILGQVYEQFLGKVIRLTEGHQAKVDDKPEVKKAGGVYYTPTYIVDYIVTNTVGKLLGGTTSVSSDKENGRDRARPSKELTPKQAAKLRILDPACGSGSFLIGAYQHLLDWHRDWYSDNEPKKWATGRKPVLYQGFGGEWKLTTGERKRILLQNIFGVDIDAQAVETTKLSLLLKVLEGESEQTLATQLRFYHERALPDLGRNIKCGNSLIGPDFYDQQQMLFLDEKERYRINVFDWNAEFPDIMNLGGFSAIMGNPPWISVKGKFGNDIFLDSEIDYLTSKYKGDTYRPNIYEYFVKRALTLTKMGGYHSFIVPDRLGFNEQFAEFRRELSSTTRIISLLYKARFPKVIADTLVYVCMPRTAPTNNVVEIGEFHGKRTEIKQSKFAEIQSHQFLPVTPVIDKIYFKSRFVAPLSSVISANVGFIANPKTVTDTRTSVAQKRTIRGRNVLRYGTAGHAFFEFAKKNLAGGTQDQEKLGSINKILMRKTGFPIVSTFDSSGIYPEQSLYFLFEPQRNHALKYILGILNSTLFQYIFWEWMATNRDATPQLKKVHLDNFRLRIIDFSDRAEKAQHDRMVELVDQMLDLHKELQAAKTAHAKTNVQRQIDATDVRIDKLVYELYGLSDDEIKIVESAAK